MKKVQGAITSVDTLVRIDRKPAKTVEEHINGRDFERFLDGRASEKTGERIALHLSGCEECNKKYDAEYKKHMASLEAELDVDKIIRCYPGQQ